MDKIGLIGKGFVGNAIYENFKDFHEFMIYDKDPTRANCNAIYEVLHHTKIIFVALPTPMTKEGCCDISIIGKVMAAIHYWYNDNIIILKSTVPPGTCDWIKKIYPQMRLVYSPEFLTEKNSIEDFKNSSRVVFGGEQKDIKVVKDLFEKHFVGKNYQLTDYKTAEMVKYFTNTFLATKVSFANEMYDICQALSIEYDKVKDLALLDVRIGKSHLNTPGPDQARGFGGTCFPKDLLALIDHSDKNKYNPLFLRAVWEKNLEVRPEKDWELLKGRAISEED
jgi:UDPglucose 6-dehydrogenase